MIAIINYGLGNISAFSNVYKLSNIPSRIASTPDDIEDASGIILPGVGAFDYAMEKLETSEMLDPLNEMVIRRKVPVLGICVGMQMLGVSSEEGQRPGLGWIDGVVRRFDTSNLQQDTLLPHMGWNNVNPTPGHKLFDGLESESRFYFLHSYYFQCECDGDVMSTTEYCGKFASAVNHENIFGVQFHPEKSHHGGVRLLQNFANLSTPALT